MNVCRMIGWHLLLALLATHPLAAGAPALMPLPAEMVQGEGALSLDENFSVSTAGCRDDRVIAGASRLVRRIAASTGLRFLENEGDPELEIRCGRAPHAVQQVVENESYALAITPRGALLEAPSPYGALRGMETLLQLVEPTPVGWRVPTVQIDDRPRFPWRGLLIDSCRHFLPVETLKRNLDAMAAVKLNVLHWHLSEDQGFRVESRRYPKLHTFGSDGQYYTQEQVRDVLAHARERGIRVVPEFDMPGHTTAWFVGHPELASAPGPYGIERGWGIFDPTMDPTRDEVYRFLDGFVKEMARLFPDPCFHIGGDEVSGRQWNESPHITEFKQAHGMESNEELQAHFNARLLTILARHGKKMVGWDEILQPSLPQDIVVQSWRGTGSLAEAAARGYRGILSAGYYLDHMRSAAMHYAIDPLGEHAAALSEEARARILGGEACMWSEFVTPEMIDGRIWPRAAAIAERLWSPASVTDVEDMYVRLESVSLGLEWLGLTHRSGPRRMLQRLANGRPVDDLATFASLLEPVKGYERPRTRRYTSLTPLNRLVDAVTPESDAARHFTRLVDRFLADEQRQQGRAEIQARLSDWKAIRTRLDPLLKGSPHLAEVEPIAADLSAAAALALRALDARLESTPEDRALLDRIDTARAELLLMVAPTIRKLVDATSPPVAAAGHPPPLAIAVFAESGFPAVDVPPIDPESLRSALAGYEVTLLGLDALRERLAPERFNVIVLPYGSAFPKDGWLAIRRFLDGGGSWVNLGGAPFAVPIVRVEGRWRMEPRRTAYHKMLGITQVSPVSMGGLTVAPPANASGPGLTSAEAYRAATIFELLPRLTGRKLRPEEDGSDGPREASVVPLAHALDRDGVPRAAPFVQIDRLDGRFNGGRWVFATGDGALSPATVRALVDRAAAGAQQLDVRPAYAGFLPGEPARLTVVFHRPRRGASAVLAGPCRVELRDRSGELLEQTTVELEEDGTSATARMVLPSPPSGAFATGLYRVLAELPVKSAGRGTVETIRAESGFLVYEPEMLAGGRPITAGRDYFLRDGRPFPVTGTSYMASDVHRRFLLEPDPWVWERDFAAMAAAGVNLVRTGIWTGWKEHCAVGAEPSEAVLRAIEVFLLTARAHDIPVIFTLFAFLPESWGGANPYLDPESVAAQARFAGAIARRLGAADDIVWDLINEPSFSSRARLWQCRPNYDRHEESAWTAWLRDTVPALDDETRAGLLADRWGGMPGDPLGLPALDAFDDRNLFGNTRPTKAADYRRFAQYAFTTWVRSIGAAIRDNGNPRQLITVGQDEGGIIERPNPLFFGEAIDFTTNHTWWFNDALLWDALMTKLPDRPNLIEETGRMVYERPDGTVWRDEWAARSLLERKLALALGGGAAGFVQWVWNINVYMPSDNEAGIGFHRADGTVRSELGPLTGLARFASKHRDLFTGRVPEEVALVIPHSRMFSARNLATEATQRAVRTMEYALGTPLRVVAEHAVREGLGAPRLILLPAPRVMRSSSWDGLLDAVERGATLLVTGTFDRDEYERPVDRSGALGLSAAIRPVAPGEELTIGDRVVPAGYRGTKLERVEKAVFRNGDPAAVRTVAWGKGTILWSPLPVELSNDAAPTTALYAHALEHAGLTPASGEAADPALLVRPIVFETAVLHTLVNESDRPRTIGIATGGAAAPLAVTVPARRVVMLFVDRTTGAALGRYPEEEQS